VNNRERDITIETDSVAPEYCSTDTEGEEREEEGRVETEGGRKAEGKERYKWRERERSLDSFVYHSQSSYLELVLVTESRIQIFFL
jgi:hypothetical protein